MPRYHSRKKLSRAERMRLKRQERFMKIGIVSVSVGCVAALALMPLLNNMESGVDYRYTSAEDVWYVESGSMEIASAELERKPVTLITALPTAVPTAVPTAEPTVVPTAEPTAEPTPAPTAFVGSVG